MDPTALGFLRTILETPSPSGYESGVQRFVRDYAKEFADEIRTDLHGNVIVVKNPDAPLRVMFAGHCDQIGLIVQHIDDEGFIYVQPIGGWDPQMLIGQRMTVWTADGPVFGVIARKPIHLLTEDERKQVPKIKDLWLDIGAKNKEEASQAVRIGDAMTVELGFHTIRNNLAVSPAMDDKAGCWVVVEALRRASQSGKLTCGLYAVSTVQEEIGLAAPIPAPSASIRRSVWPSMSATPPIVRRSRKRRRGMCAGRGPAIHRGPNMNPKVVERLIQAADGSQIAYQLVASSKATGTDANAMQISRGGVATGLISIPNRYMHSPVEMISLEDIDRAADLLARFAERLDAEAEFTP